jgi:polyisoprenoid-binding protein YceI
MDVDGPDALKGRTEPFPLPERFTERGLCLRRLLPARPRGRERRGDGMGCSQIRWAFGTILALLIGLPSIGASCDLPPRPETSRQSALLRFDARQSLVRFDAKAFLHTFAGTTHRVEGTIRLGDLDRLQDAEACVRIDAASLTTDNAMRDRTMRAEHLETARYPIIEFRLLGVEDVRHDAQGWSFAAKGTLSLHGVTRQVVLPVRARQEGEAVRLTGRLPLRMTDYGIPVPRFLLLRVEDQVVVSFDVLARRATE